ncbi:MAG: ABC transporter permease [Chloroflexota bacterium]|nr:ABC transporter permease [Chloroflexota bacterium]
MIRLVFVNALYSYKALFNWNTPELYVLQKVMYPLVQLSFFVLIGAFGGAQPVSFYLVGNCMVVAFRPMFAVTRAIAEERSGGTLPYLVATPASRLLLFFGRAVFNVIDGMFDIALAFLFATLVFGLALPPSGWPGMFLAVFTASFAAAGLGFFLGAVAYVVLDAGALGNTMMFALLLLTGANVPLAQLPGAVRALGEALPLTHTIAAARLYAAGADVAAGLPLLGSDLVLGAIWGLGGFALFSYFEVQARRRGTLEGL